MLTHRWTERGCGRQTGKREKRHAIATTRGRCDDAEIPARQIRDRRGRRDHLHARLGQDDAGARHLGGAQRDPRCRAEGRPTSTACSIYSGGDSTSATFIAGDLGIRLNFYMDVVGGGSSTEALVGIAIGLIEAGMLQDRRDLPLDERLLAGAHRRHRRALGGAGRRRHAAQPRLWLAERRAEFRADLHAPHVRLRHDARAGGAREDVPQPSTPRTIRRPTTRSASRSRTCINSRIICKPLHLLDCCVETDNATCIIVTTRRAGEGLQAPAGADPRRRRALQQAARSTCTTSTGRSRRVAGYYAKDILWPNSGVGPEDIDVDRLLRRLHLHHDAAARGLRLLQEGRGRPVRQRRHDQARRQAAEQHLGRPSVRGLYARHEHGDRERAAAAPRRRRLLPDRAGRQAPAHLRLPRGRLPPGQGMSRSPPISAGPTRRPARRWSCGAAEPGRRTEQCQESRPPISACRCRSTISTSRTSTTSSTARRTISICRPAPDCGLLRYPPTTACPWCMTLEVDLGAGRGQGRGAFLHRGASRHPAGVPRAHALLVLLVDLDTQKGEPTAHEALRVVGNLMHAGRPAGAAGHGEAGRHRHARAHGVHRCGRGSRRCRNGRSTRPRRSRQLSGAIRRSSAPLNQASRLTATGSQNKNPRHGGGFRLEAAPYPLTPPIVSPEDMRCRNE